jgi:DNA-binding NtrC family response regulator
MVSLFSQAKEADAFMKNQPKVLLVDDDGLTASLLTRPLMTDGYDVRSTTSAHDIIKSAKSWSPSVVLLDTRLPQGSGIEILKELLEFKVAAKVVMLTSDGKAENAVKAMKLGATDYLTKPFTIDEVRTVLRNITASGPALRESDCLRKAPAGLINEEILGNSHHVMMLKAKLGKMAMASVSTILITGESGTGKELFARHAHRLMHAGRAARAPFIRVNCAALPENLLESELFGHVRGSFTDAKADKKGLFELACGGSILLDEIGEMKLNLQAKLLRVIEERRLRPVGGNREIPVNVTVIATTNRDLTEAAERGQFRTDLFFRLSAFHLHVPALRERAEDIPVLARWFLSDFSKRHNKNRAMRFSPDAEKIIAGYAWPGNIRELRNVVERLVVLESAEVLGPEHLPSRLSSARAGRPMAETFALPEKGIRLQEVEKDLIRQALDRTKNNKAQAARLLHITYDALRYQVKKLGLE